MVVTGAIPERRIATEINGFPAAEEYARAVGLELSQLNPLVFSAHPMVVKIGGADFVRSIQKVNPDGSLTFFCAIDEGIVINVAKGVDLVDNLNTLFGDIEQRIGPPRLVIGCDCILRTAGTHTERLDRPGLGHSAPASCGRLQHLWRAVPRHARQPDLHRHRHRRQEGRGMNDPNDIRCDLDDAAGLLGEIRRRDRIITALMNQVQRNLNNPDNDFSLLQTTFVLEEEVKRRTEELERALDALAKAKEELQKSHSELEDRVAERTAELSQQLHFLQQLIEAIPGPVFYKDAQLRYLGCNSAFAAFIGQPASELIGKTSYEIAPSRELADEYLAADRNFSKIRARRSTTARSVTPTARCAR